jgi:FlgD Ig-like domain
MKSLLLLVAVLLSVTSIPSLETSISKANTLMPKNSMALCNTEELLYSMTVSPPIATTPINVCDLDYSSYDESTWLDPSFEGKAQNHGYELSQINTYFIEYAPIPKQFFENIANFLTTSVLADVLAETSYLLAQTYSNNCESIRLCSDQVAALSVTERNAYLSRLNYIKQHYSFTSIELQYIRTEIQSVLPLGSNSLNYSLTLLLEYIDLVEELQYSKLEVFRDFTGFCNPTEYMAMVALNDAHDYPLAFQRTEQGLGANEAIKRLQMLSNDQQLMLQVQQAKINFAQGEKIEIKLPLMESLDLDKCKFDVYPNPGKSNERININLEVVNDISNVSIKVLDLAGKEIKTLSRKNALPEGYYNYIWDGTNSSGGRVSNGVYYCLLTSEQTGVAAIKIIISN